MPTWSQQRQGNKRHLRPRTEWDAATTEASCRSSFIRCRSLLLRGSTWIALLLFGLALPAASQEVTNTADGLCRSMGPELVMAISGGILILVFVILGLIYWRLQNGGWSLANAASEPTVLRIPLDANWAQSQGDKQSLSGMSNPKGPVVSLTLMEASSSRLIALVGMVAILLIYVGFGVFSLYSFGLTCQMPASTVAVSTFLYSGLTLFAPYVANKVSGLLQPLRTPQTVTPELVATPPSEAFSPAPAQDLPKLPAVSSAVRRAPAATTGGTLPHRIAGAPMSSPVTEVESATTQVLSRVTSPP